MHLFQASYAEHYILLLKRKLYMILRSKLSKDWIHYLPIVTEAFNNTPLKKLGFLKPSDIQSEADTIKVENALKSHGLKPIELPTFQEQNKNQQTYEAKAKNIQVNTYCYLDFGENVFDKAYDVSVGLNIYCQLHN